MTVGRPTFEQIMQAKREIEARPPVKYLPIHPSVLKRPEWPEVARAMLRKEPGCIIDANGRARTEEDYC